MVFLNSDIPLFQVESQFKESEEVFPLNLSGGKGNLEEVLAPFFVMATDKAPNRNHSPLPKINARVTRKPLSCCCHFPFFPIRVVYIVNV